MNGEQQTESECAAGAWAWVQRNDTLLMGVLIIAMMQYQTIQIAASLEQLILRLTILEERMVSLECRQERFAERLAGQPGARAAELGEDAAELADCMNRLLGRIEDKPGLSPPEAPPGAAGAAPVLAAFARVDDVRARRAGAREARLRGAAARRYNGASANRRRGG